MLRPLQILAITLCLLPSLAAHAQCLGDVDDDGVVDELDVDLVEQHWGWGTNCPLPHEDCPVDEADHQALVDTYWGPCPM